MVQASTMTGRMNTATQTGSAAPKQAISSNQVMINNMAISLLKFQQKAMQQASQSLNTYGKVGLDIFTVGGKSIIAKSFIDSSYQRVLWISPKKAGENVKIAYFSGKQYDKKITWVNFQTLARLSLTERQIILDTGKYAGVYLDAFDLIVIDEAHSALGLKTEQGVKAILEMATNAHLIAMTATSERYSDGRNSLLELIPEGQGDIVEISLEEAVRDKYLNRIDYIIQPQNISKEDLRIMESFVEKANKYGHYNQEIMECKQFIANYSVKLEDTLGGFLETRKEYDGSEGDRYIAFFSTIEELERTAHIIERVFEEKYPQCEINIMKLHNNTPHREQEGIIKEMNAAPIPNQIDVLLNIGMGAQSIHPKNMRGIIMYRYTNSEGVWKQQIGRVMSLREVDYAPLGAFVYDFMDNLSAIGRNTLAQGVRSFKEREQVTDKSVSIDEIRRKLQRDNPMSELIKQQFADEELAKNMGRLSTYIDHMPWQLMFDEVAALWDNYKQNNGGNEPESVYELFVKGNTHHDKLKAWFYNIQGHFMGGAYRISDDLIPKLKEEQIASFGVAAWVKMACPSIPFMHGIKKVGDLLAAVGGDYTKLNQKRGLCGGVNKLRVLNLQDRLDPAAASYAKYLGIDVECLQELTDADKKMISKALGTNVVNNMDKIKAELEGLRNNPTLQDEEREKIARRMYAKLLVVSKGENIYGYKMANKMIGEYAIELNISGYPTQTIEQATSMAVLLNMREDEGVSWGNSNLIIETMKNYKSLEPLTFEMLKTQKITRKTFKEKFMHRTDWYKKYNQALEKNDASMALALLNGKRGDLPPEYRSLLNSEQFKELVEVNQEAIQNSKLRLAVANFYQPDTSARKIIEDSLKSGTEIDVIVSYAFNPSIEQMMLQFMRGRELTEANKRHINFATRRGASLTAEQLNNLYNIPIMKRSAQLNNAMELIIELRSNPDYN